MQIEQARLADVLADEPSGAWLEELSALYGKLEPLLVERAGAWKTVVKAFQEKFGDHGELFMLRAPARANLLGRHSDFQGGRSNGTCLPMELLAVARFRRDDTVAMADVRSSLFPDRSFSIADWLPPEWRGKEWYDYLHHVYSQLIPGDWINYAQGPVLRQQNMCPDRQLCGFDAMILGNVVRAAGLSSSSSLSCLATLAVAIANDIEMSREEVALESGRGEHFTGTRGGAGDQAVIMLTPLGKVLHNRTRPHVEYELLDFPKSCVLVVMYSGLPAKKAVGRAKNDYNEHAAAYQFGVKLLNRQGEGLEKVSMIADLIGPELGLTEKQVLEAVRALPERITRPELRKVCAGEEKWFEQIIATHEEPQAGYAVRKICLFGVAEFSRSRMAPALLGAGDLKEFGRLMYASHDGDRVVEWSADGKARPHDNEAPDGYMDELVAGANVSRGEYKLLPHQPGGYPNSCWQTDRIVDICKEVEGVYGACLTGAGFGGHVLALVAPDQVVALFAGLKRDFYEANGIPFGAQLCTAASSATVHRLVC
ncbi:MAG: galactokinase family protein [Candidatus Brocadiia bacterium]|jgi:galactokinase|nr:galactokinase family protein [Candidatus Brocadiia bacterium]